MIAEQIAVLKTKSCTITLSGWIEVLFFPINSTHLVSLKFWSEPSPWTCLWSPSPFFMVGAQYSRFQIEYV